MKKVSNYVKGIIALLFMITVVASCNTKTDAAEVQQLDDGVYTIASSINSNYVLDVSQSGLDNGTNIQVWQSNSTIAQSFYISYAGNGYYTIKCVVSGKALDVSSSGTANGTNIQQWDSNGTNAQLWKLVSNADNTYSFVSACNNKYMDLSNSNASNGGNIQIWDGNGSNAQKFVLTAQTQITNGIYTITSTINRNYAFDISNSAYELGANVQIFESNGSNAQKFDIEYVGNGLYTVKNLATDKYLDVCNSGQSNGTNIQQWEGNGTDAQLWYIRYTDGGFTFQSKCNGLYIDITNGSMYNGNNVQLYAGYDTNYQKFNLSNTSYSQSVNTGYYTIRSGLNLGFVLDIDNGSEYNGANLQLYQSNDSNAQKFYISYVGDGYYQIQSVSSGLLLDVNNSGKSNGTNIQQYSSNNSDAQKWKIYMSGDGRYIFVNKCNNLCIDVNNSGVYNGNNIQCWEFNGSDAQKLVLSSTTPDYRGWVVTNGRKYYYSGNSELQSQLGIDVSSHQGYIDWDAVKNDGIQFAIIRVGYGDNETYQDDYYASRNISECERLGIPYGVYLYSYATCDDQASSEIDHILRMISGKNPSLGVFIDIEDTDTYTAAGIDIYSDSGRAQITGWTKRICDAVSAAGYAAGIYANYNYYCNVLYSDQLSGYRWLAFYGTDNEPTQDYSCPSGSWYMWQYTSRGSVNGISGDVDMDVMLRW